MVNGREILQPMQHRRLARLAFAAALAAAPLAFSAATSATPAEVKPGMQVVDPSGGAVGTVTSVQGDTLTLKAGTHEVQLPLASFTANQGKLLFGMTAAQLEAAMASAQASVAAGANVYGSDGTLAGSIESVEDSLVTIKLASGGSVRIPRSGVSASANGAVLGITTAKLNELTTQASTEPATPRPQAAEAGTEAPKGK
jgi:preprotein translocase subunit YajC